MHMKNWIQSDHCKSRAHCFACRNDDRFRASILRAGLTETRDFECPEGATIGRTENLPTRKMGLGDIIEKVAKPFAKAMKLDCLDANNDLKPQSPCARRRDALNRIGRQI